MPSMGSGLSHKPYVPNVDSSDSIVELRRFKKTSRSGRLSRYATSAADKEQADSAAADMAEAGTKADSAEADSAEAGSAEVGKETDSAAAEAYKEAEEHSAEGPTPVLVPVPVPVQEHSARLRSQIYGCARPQTMAYRASAPPAEV